MIYTITFNPSLDYVIQVDHFKPGIINKTKFEEILPGGKGINVSIVLSNLGHESTALGFMAGFTGEEIEHRLESYGAKTDIKSINMEDIKAPSSMNDYRKGIDDGIKNYRTIIKNANPSQSASLARAKLSKNNKEDMKKLSNQLKSDYNNAKIAEIGNALATSDYKKIAIPTQDYVKLLRKDLQPGAIAQIRRQQAQEVALISQIEEKWERKYNLAKLLIDKEVILSQTFDEKKAREEVNRIVNSN